MIQQTKKPKSWFRRVLEKYDRFIKTYNLDQPSCCGVPKIREDENGYLKKPENFLKK